MAALSIAFDIIIVGALSLPWLLLVIHLFFSDDEHTLKKHLQWVKDQKEPALAGVLLFAMTYSLGTVVSRIAQDFFDDDDVYIHASHHLFRVGVTESSIRTNVFCNAFKDSDTSQLSDQTTGKHEQSRTSNSAASDSTAAKHEKFKKNDPDCQYTGRWIVRTYNPDTHQPVTAPVTGERITAEWINKQQDLARDIFYAKEAAVLLKGTDPTERIRQFHDQIMVLRGAAFGGLVAFSLCLFWWSAQSLPGLGWAVSLFYALIGFIASSHHLSETPLTDPPYMEFTWLVLAAAGGYVLWKHTPKGKRSREKPHNGPKPISFGYVVLAAFLTIAASLGWWATQVLYDQQVIFSYQAMSDRTAKPATPSQK